MKTRYLRHLVKLGVVPWLFLASCSALGPRNIPNDRFDYNEAISRSANEQMLLNLVRMRYRDVPVFLAVTAVLTQYVYSGRVSVAGSGGSSLGDPLYQVGGSAAGIYIERPTITYSPLTGEKFAKQLLTPIPGETLFSLIQSGWPAGQLLTMGIERLNRVENVSFQPLLSQENVERRDAFQHAVRLIVELGKRRAIEMQRDEAKPEGPRYLVFESAPDAETQKLIDELKQVLGLNPELSVFRVTRQWIRRDADEITLRVRSLLAMMGYLSRGVEVPEAHAKEKRVEVLDSSDKALPSFLVPLRIFSAKDPPANAFVAVKYQDYWFYIGHGDHSSKQAFGLLTYLYQLQAPQAPSAGPLLTVPTG